MYRIALNVAISFYRKEKKWSIKNDFYNEESIFKVEEDTSEIASELDYHLKLDSRIIFKFKFFKITSCIFYWLIV